MMVGTVEPFRSVEYFTSFSIIGYTLTRPNGAPFTPQKAMADSEKYTPLSERLQQDVWHDNFVPKYSALASAEPSKLVLTGVWLIFAPMALGSIVIGLAMLSDSPDLASAIVFVVMHALIGILATTILFTQTRRYRLAKLRRNDDLDDNQYADNDMENV